MTIALKMFMTMSMLHANHDFWWFWGFDGGDNEKDNESPSCQSSALLGGVLEAKQGGKHPSRSALGPFQPKILQRDWPSPITVANAGLWLVEPALLGERPVSDTGSGNIPQLTRIPGLEQSLKMFWMHLERETLKNIRAMGTRLNFAIWNNKQTFLHLDILFSSDYTSIFDDRGDDNNCNKMVMIGRCTEFQKMVNLKATNSLVQGFLIVCQCIWECREYNKKARFRFGGGVFEKPI